MKKLLAMLMAIAMLCGVLAGCGGGGEVSNLEPVDGVPEDTYEIQWYLMADPQNDVESVEVALNEYLKDKINATVQINILPSAQYTQKVGTMVNAGEYFDLAFVARWAIDYINNSRSGAFFDLTDHLDTYLKETTETIGKDNLQYSYVDGRIYAMPVYKEMAVQYGWVYRKDIADKYNIDMSQYKTFKDLEPVLQMIKEKEPDMNYPLDWAASSDTPATFVDCANYIFDDGRYDGMPVNKYAIPEFKEAVELARDFYNKGYVRPDVLTATDKHARMAEGKTFVVMEPLKPGKVTELFKNSKYEFAQIATTEPKIDYLAGTGSMQAISVTSKNPARVMKFLNLLNTDPYVKNLVVHGIEGKHYNKIDDKTIEPIEGSGYSLYTNTWAVGNVFLDYLVPDDDPNKLEDLKAFNDSATGSHSKAFAPKEVTDPERKQRKLEISNTVSNYWKQLAVGAVDVEPTLTEFLETLEKVGIEQELADTAAEYEEFLKTRE